MSTVFFYVVSNLVLWSSGATTGLVVLRTAVLKTRLSPAISRKSDVFTMYIIFGVSIDQLRLMVLK